MAYNRKHYLEKIIEIQTIALKYNRDGLFYKEIYHRYIEKQYHISKRTFDNYLGINAKKELKAINNMANLEITTMINTNPHIRVFLTDIELKNGTTSKMMTVFDNSTIGFEEVYIGIKQCLKHINEAKAMQSSMFSVKNNTLEPSGINYQRQEVVNMYLKE